MTTTNTNTITINPADPFAGLVDPADVADLGAEVATKGARVLAVELLSGAAAATGWTWDDTALAALTRALEKMAD